MTATRQLAENPYSILVLVDAGLTDAEAAPLAGLNLRTYQRRKAEALKARRNDPRTAAALRELAEARAAAAEAEARRLRQLANVMPAAS